MNGEELTEEDSYNIEYYNTKASILMGIEIQLTDLISLSEYFDIPEFF